VKVHPRSGRPKAATCLGYLSGLADAPYSRVMVGLRITFALLVGWLATSAAAADRSASFGVTVRVVAPLRVRTAAAAAPASVAAASTQRPVSTAAAIVTSPGSAGAAIPTILPDGAPTAIVER
jgi:hypothetical protein